MSTQRATQLVEAGLWLRLSGDQEGARRLFEQALKLDPGNVRAKQLLESGPAGPAVSKPVAGESRKPPADPFARPDPPRPLPPAPVDLDWGMATGFDEPPPPRSHPEHDSQSQSASGVQTIRLGGDDSQAPSTLMFGLKDLESKHQSFDPFTDHSEKPPPLSDRFTAPPVPDEPLFMPPRRDDSASETLVFGSDLAPPPPIAPPPVMNDEVRNTMVFGFDAPGPEELLPPSSSTLVYGPGGNIPPPASTAPDLGGTLVFGSQNSSPAAYGPSSDAPVVGTTLVYGPGTAAPAAGNTLVFSSGGVPTMPSVIAQSPRTGGTLVYGPGGGNFASAPVDAPSSTLVFGSTSEVAFDLPPLDEEDKNTGWDGGSNPGIDLDQSQNAPPQGVGFDLISNEPPPPSRPRSAAQLKDEVGTLLRGAKDLLELDDHTGAIELMNKAQELDPNNPEVARLKDRSEETLVTMYESKLGNLEATPRVKLKDDEIIWLNLDHRAGFVLAQIDGSITFEDVFAVSGMTRLDTARILSQLVEEGVVSRGG